MSTRRSTLGTLAAAALMATALQTPALADGGTQMSGDIVKIYLDALPTSNLAVNAGGASRPGMAYPEAAWYLTQGSTSAEVLWRLDFRGSFGGGDACKPSLRVDGRDLYSGPAKSVPLFDTVLDQHALLAVSSIIGEYTSQFSVDCGLRGTATWTMPLFVIPSVPPDGEAGVSVNASAEFTNSPQVRIQIGWDDLVDKVKVSNDGGFPAVKAKEFRLEADGFVEWALVDLGNERLPKTVYVKLHHPVDGWSKTYTDDIILDTVKPQVLSASLSGSGAATLAGPRVLRVKARDNKSGLASIQVSAGKPKKKAKVLKFRKSVPAPKSGQVFVRVRDGAGNWSRWRAAG